MSDRFIPPYSLGQTGASGTLTGLAGHECEHLDLDYSNVGSYAQAPLTESTIHAVWVKNDSGGAVNGKTGITWKSGYYRTRIGAASGSLAVASGFVDPYITSVADGDYCWVIFKGPCTGISDGAAAISQGNSVVTAGSGKVTKLPTTAADAITAQNQAVAVCGQAMEAATNVDGTTFRFYANCK